MSDLKKKYSWALKFHYDDNQALKKKSSFCLK